MESADAARAESRYASRKLRLALLVIAVAAGAEWLGKLSPALADVLKWTFAVYCGFNVAQKGAEWVATFFAKEPAK